MAIRLTIDGVMCEVDTVPEAAELLKLLARQKSASHAATARWQSAAQTAQRPQQLRPDPDALHPVFGALYDAQGHTLRGEYLAKAINVKSAKSLPPTFAHLRAWLRRVGESQPIDAFIRRAASLTPNQPGTVYSLTSDGIRLVEKARQIQPNLPS
jgi:hypothetical protein